METITNAAQAAAKAVWGETGDTKEPVSGEAGDVSKGEPFDAGNNNLAQDEERPNADKSANKRDTGDGQDDTRKTGESGTEEEQVDLKGPGPKPLETVAAEHGGDAGKDDTASDSAEKEDGDQEGAEEENKGTGEEYVKSSGLKADGGDFDAANPGAGREADRLMEEKGMNREEGKGQGDTKDSTLSDDKKDDNNKPRLTERIKAKFHKS